MGSEWKEVLVGVYAKLQGGYAFKSKDFIEQGFPVVKIKNVKHREIDLADVGYVNENIAIKAKDYYIKNGSILICMTGSGIHAPNSIVGRVARHQGEDDAFLINQRVGRFIITEPKLLNEGFLYYFLSPKEMQWKLVSIASGSANQVNISGKQIENIEIPLPPLPEQKAIAHILGSLDDKIELNRKMNATLEGMAQALFKSWFVDFDPVIDNAIVAGNDIPEEFAERAEIRRKALADGSANREAAGQFPDAFRLTEEKGWIPEGWEAKEIVDEVNLTMGQSPSSKHYNKDGIGLPFHQGVTNYGERFPKHEHFSTDGTRYAMQGDILFSVRAPVGRINISDRHIIIGRGLSALRHKRNYQGFLMYFLKNIFQKEDTIGSGTIFNAVTKKDMERILCIVPTDVITKEFDNIAISLDEKIAKNAEQTQALTNLRDTLLPKLISGELRVPEAEKVVEEAMS